MGNRCYLPSLSVMLFALVCMFFNKGCMCVYETLASLMLTTAYRTLLRGKLVCPLCLAQLT